MTELKQLPREKNGTIARKFVANGTTYKILDASATMSLARYTEFSRMSAVVGFGVNFEGMLTHLQEIQKLVFDIDAKNSLTKKGAILKVESLLELIIKTSQERFDQAFYFCTLFIVREGEDLTIWDFDDATDKVNDWNTEGYSANDFFSVAASTIPNFAQAWHQMKKEVEDHVISTISA